MAPPKQAKLTVTGKDFIIRLICYQKEIVGYESLIERAARRIEKLERAGQNVDTLLRLLHDLKNCLNDYKKFSELFEDANRLYEQPMRFRGGVQLELKNKDFINEETIDKCIPRLYKAIVKRREQLVEEENKSFKDSNKTKQNMTSDEWDQLQQKHKENLKRIEEHRQYQLADNVDGGGISKKSTQKAQSYSAENTNTAATELSEAIKVFHLQLSLLIIQFNLLNLSEWEEKCVDFKVLISNAITALKVEVPQAEQELLAETMQSNEAMIRLFNDDGERKSRVSIVLQNHLSIEEIGMLFETDLPDEISVVNTGHRRQNANHIEPQAGSSGVPKVSAGHSMFSSSVDQAASSSSSFDQGREAVSHLPKQALGGSQQLKIFKRGENTKSPRKNSDGSATPPGSVKLPGIGKKPG